MMSFLLKWIGSKRAMRAFNPDDPPLYMLK